MVVVVEQGPDTDTRRGGAHSRSPMAALRWANNDSWGTGHSTAGWAQPPDFVVLLLLRHNLAEQAITVMCWSVCQEPSKVLNSETVCEKGARGLAAEC